MKIIYIVKAYLPESHGVCNYCAFKKEEDAIKKLEKLRIKNPKIMYTLDSLFLY